MSYRVFIEPQQGTTYDEIVALARAAEAAGFDGFFSSDHYLRMGDGSPGPGPTDAWTTLAGLARDTSRLRLGTLVTPVTFRLPGPHVIAVAQIDAMSKGRVELGLGAGWFDQEHKAHGIPFPATRERFERLEDYLAIVTGMWAAPAGERFSYTGRHWSVTDSPGLPKPVQAGGVPIVMGGAGAKRTPRLAATYASDFNVPFCPVDFVKTQHDRVRAACEAQGRDPATMVYSAALVCCVGATEAEYRNRAAVYGRDPAELRENGACGSPEEVLAKLDVYRAAGVERFYLQLLDITDVDQVSLLGSVLGS